MKWKIIFAILAVIIIAGCAQDAIVDKGDVTEDKDSEPAVVDQPTPTPQPTPTLPPEPVVEEPKVTTETIIIKDDSAEPSSLTVQAGSTIMFKSDSSRVNVIQLKFPGMNDRSPRLNRGDVWEVTLTEPGEYDFNDIIIVKAKGTIIVE